MDATTAVLLAKIASDLLIVLALAIPKVDGLTEEEKNVMLAGLQKNTNDLVAKLTAMANQ